MEQRQPKAKNQEIAIPDTLSMGNETMQKIMLAHSQYYSMVVERVRQLEAENKALKEEILGKTDKPEVQGEKPRIIPCVPEG